MRACERQASDRPGWISALKAIAPGDNIRKRGMYLKRGQAFS